MKKGISTKVIQRIETLEGKPAGEALTELYVQQLLTYRMLCKRWGLQPAQLIKLIKHYGIEPRKGSEAIKVQWLGNTERRLATATKMSEVSRELVAQGRHARIGLTKENSESIRLMALKLKETTSFHTSTVQQKCSVAHSRRYAANPDSHPNAKATPTRCEQLMIDHLIKMGQTPLFSYNIAPYWIDIFLPEFGIGIECVNKKRPTWVRHEHIVQQGAHMLYVTNDFIERGDFRQLDEYITNFQAISTDPSFKSEEAMIWGSKYVFFFTDQPDNILIEVIKMDELHCLRLING